MVHESAPRRSRIQFRCVPELMERYAHGTFNSETGRFLDTISHDRFQRTILVECAYLHVCERRDWRDVWQSQLDDHNQRQAPLYAVEQWSSGAKHITTTWAERHKLCFGRSC